MEDRTVFRRTIIVGIVLGIVLGIVFNSANTPSRPVLSGNNGTTIRIAPEPCDCTISSFSCLPTVTIRCRCRGCYQFFFFIISVLQKKKTSVSMNVWIKNGVLDVISLPKLYSILFIPLPQWTSVDLTRLILHFSKYKKCQGEKMWIYMDIYRFVILRQTSTIGGRGGGARVWEERWGLCPRGHQTPQLLKSFAIAFPSIF